VSAHFYPNFYELSRTSESEASTFSSPFVVKCLPLFFHALPSYGRGDSCSSEFSSVSGEINTICGSFFPMSITATANRSSVDLFECSNKKLPSRRPRLSSFPFRHGRPLVGPGKVFFNTSSYGCNVFFSFQRPPPKAKSNALKV